MSDTTLVGTMPTMDPVAEITRLSKAALELAEKLRDHGETLRLRGMTAPAGAAEALQTVGSSLQLILNRFDGSQVELQQLRELARTTELINSTLDLDHVLYEVTDAVIQLTGAERGYIVLKDAETGGLSFRVARNKKKEDIAQADFVVSRTVVERVAAEGELLVTVNASEDQELKESESVANLQLRSILCVPLKRKGEVTGLIYVDNRIRPNLFTEREQKVVSAFAHQAALAIENARLFERVNASLAEIIQIEEGAIGMPLYSVLPPLYEGFERLMAEVRKHNLNQTVEVDPVVGTRGQVSLDLKLSPLKNGTETQGVAIVVDDLTELKQRQAQLSVVRRYLPPEMVDNIKTIDELELGGVEREDSILFFDVRGFTTFSETVEPE